MQYRVTTQQNAEPLVFLCHLLDDAFGVSGMAETPKPFQPLGISMAGIRDSLTKWHRECSASPLSSQQLLSSALRLLRSPQPHYRVAGLSIIYDDLLASGRLRWQRDLVRFERLFIEGVLGDWSICDWFSTRILATLLEQQGSQVAKRLKVWSRSSDFWLQRAAVTTFAHLARKGESVFPGFVADTIEVCRYVVKSPEKLHQSAVGWALRELAKYDKQAVENFLATELSADLPEIHEPLFSKLPEDLRLRGHVNLTQLVSAPSTLEVYCQ